MKVYLSEDIAPSAYKRLEAACELTDSFDDMEEIGAILTRNIKIGREMMERAKKLKIISVHGTGTDLVDVEAAQELGIKVTNVPGENAQSVAELAVSFMLALSKKLKRIDAGLKEGRWNRPGHAELSSREVSGKTLGLMGTGSVARHVARMMGNGFNMRILCWNPRRTKEECAALGFEKCEDLKELFGVCDFVSVHIPFNAETEGLINAEIFKAAKQGLVFVNTSRGGIVNEDDLYDALVNGKLAAAASDVFVVEPPAKESKLLRLDNFIATPHIGATTEEALDRVGNKAVDNILLNM